jgi:opacity protein-like surface antigen
MILNTFLKTGIIFLLIFMGHRIFAQKNKIEKVEGFARVKMEKNMTLQQTREKAKELAKINAIENAFGTYVEQQTDMTINNGETDYNIIGTTRVKGDWIKTTSVKFSDEFRKEKTDYGYTDIRWVTCKITGKARKASPKPLIRYEILSTPDKSSRTVDFHDGEQLYLWFKSPVNGYLTIFLEDDEAVYRLLPYSGDDEKYKSGYLIKADKDYIFFSRKNASTPDDVDELILHTSKPLEYNYVYIIFSENKFSKPGLNDKKTIKDRILPLSLTKQGFREWLAYNRSLDPKFQSRKIKISISNH